METLFDRSGSTLTLGDGLTATIPNDVSALSILATNRFLPNSDYRDDGYIYIDKKPVKKWFKNIDDVKIWFPILEDIKELQRRYNVVKQAYSLYWKNVCEPAFDAVLKAKKAHVKVTHKFQGDYDPWWLYTASEHGISFDWVDKPKNPINLKIGTEYYIASKRSEQLGGRLWKFKTVLMRAIYSKVYEVEGSTGDLLQVKVLDRIYWFQYGRYTWEVITSDDNFKSMEL